MTEKSSESNKNPIHKKNARRAIGSGGVQRSAAPIISVGEERINALQA